MSSDIDKIAIIGYSPNMVSMLLDNLHSQNYVNNITIFQNEFNSEIQLEDIWHPHIEVEIKKISELENDLWREPFKYFMGVYKTQTKINVFQKYQEFLKSSLNIIHKNTEISASTKIGTGNMINTGVLIAGNSNIGNYCCINRGSSIGHHTQIADFCTINPSVTICGAVTLEHGVTIGASATVIDGITIGKNSIIGAGSVVVSDIPPNSLVMGIPGKVIRTV